MTESQVNDGYERRGEERGSDLGDIQHFVDLARRTGGLLFNFCSTSYI